MHSPSDWKQSSPLVTVGLLTYNSEHYLPQVLPSLLEQSYGNFEIVILDNASTDGSAQYIEEHFPQIRLISSPKNLGFGAGHNVLIRESIAPYYLCANVDMLFNEHFVRNLVMALDSDISLASVTGKLLRWDFKANTKTSIIDSIGLGITRSLTFYDLSQGEEDKGQFDEEKEIFGCSGAAVMYRKSSLTTVAYRNNDNGSLEYFDELMFMYKEDLDLALRLRLAGYSARYIPSALAHHDRTASVIPWWKRKQAMSHFVRAHSYLNQKILEYKHAHYDYSVRTKCTHACYRFLRSLYVHLFERDLVGVSSSMTALLRRLEQKKRDQVLRLPVSELERWF